jgi:hypothetical protein
VAVIQSRGFRCRTTAPYSSRPSGFILPLSMIMIIGKHGVRPSLGNEIVKSGNSAARRDSLRSRTLWARRKSTAVLGGPVFSTLSTRALAPLSIDPPHQTQWSQVR